jgi:hypothetical protein
MNLQLPGGLFPLGFTIKTLKVFVFFTFVMHSLPNSFSQISSLSKYIMKSTDYEALH